MAGRTSPILLVISAFVSVLIVVPICFLLFGMFWTSFPGDPQGTLSTEFLVAVFTGEGVPAHFKTLNLLTNTLIFSSVSATMAVALAFALAWIIHRTNTPGRRFFDVLPLITFMFPAMLGDIAWTFLLSPNAGLINLYINNPLGLPPFNIYGMGGMIWAQGLSLTALAYLLISATFGTMDPTLEEAAKISGARNRQVILKVTLPLAVPAIVSTWTLMLMIGLNSFETPAFIGLPAKVYVFMNAIYHKMSVDVPIDYGGAAALSFVSLLLSSVAVAFYLLSTRRLKRFAVITGKGYRPKPIDLGRMKYAALAFLLVYVVVGLILPVATMALMSFMKFYTVVGVNPLDYLTLKNYAFVTSEPLMLRSATNSFILAGVAGVLTTGAAAAMSYVAIRGKMRGKRALEFIAALPVAYPGMIFSLALIWTALLLFRPIYGTMTMLILAYIVVFLPYGMRTMANSMIQIHSELEEVATVSGASSLTSMRKIMLPLLRPALINTLMLVFIQSYRQLGAAILLVTPSTFVLPVVILHWWASGLLVALAAAVMIYGVILVAIVMFARYFLKASLTF